MDSLKDYINTLIDQVDSEIEHPRYDKPVILRMSIDAITRLPLFYFEELSAKQEHDNDDDEDAEKETADGENDNGYTDDDYYSDDGYYSESAHSDQSKEAHNSPSKSTAGGNNQKSAPVQEHTIAKVDPPSQQKSQPILPKGKNVELTNRSTDRSISRSTEQSTTQSSPKPIQLSRSISQFVKYNDAWIYKSKDGIYVKFTNDKYKTMNDEEVSAHAKKMIINTFGDNYAANDKYIAMQLRYKSHYDGGHAVPQTPLA
jgi:hypothetical protein